MVQDKCKRGLTAPTANPQEMVNYNQNTKLVYHFPFFYTSEIVGAFKTAFYGSRHKIMHCCTKMDFKR